MDSHWYSALHRFFRLLILEFCALVTSAATIHSTLERIVFPTKDVVAVLRKSFPGHTRQQVPKWMPNDDLHITSTPHQRLRAIFRPQVWAVEGSRLYILSS
jgi:hypothetical protein